MFYDFMIIYGLFILFSCSFSFLHCVFSMKIKKKTEYKIKKKWEIKKGEDKENFQCLCVWKIKKKNKTKRKTYPIILKTVKTKENMSK